jgi:hypothetical protein
VKQHIDNTRRQLGELAALAQQTEAMERQILERANKLLADVDGQIKRARIDALTGDDAAKEHYQHLVFERGRLHQVIANGHAALHAPN